MSDLKKVIGLHNRTGKWVTLVPRVTEDEEVKMHKALRDLAQNSQVLFDEGLVKAEHFSAFRLVPREWTEGLQ